MATNAELAMFKLAKRIAPDPGRGVHHDAARPDEPARGLPQGRQPVDLELALWQEKFDALDSSRHDS